MSFTYFRCAIQAVNMHHLCVVVFSSLIVSIRPTSCPAGQFWYTDLVSSKCANCWAGMYCPGDDAAYDCKYGYYTSAEGSVQCLPCAQGTYTGRPGNNNANFESTGDTAPSVFVHSLVLACLDKTSEPWLYMPVRESANSVGSLLSRWR